MEGEMKELKHGQHKLHDHGYYIDYAQSMQPSERYRGFMVRERKGQQDIYEDSRYYVHKFVNHLSLYDKVIPFVLGSYGHAFEDTQEKHLQEVVHEDGHGNDEQQR
jgi:hypothetical protein